MSAVKKTDLPGCFTQSSRSVLIILVISVKPITPDLFYTHGSIKELAWALGPIQLLAFSEGMHARWLSSVDAAAPLSVSVDGSVVAVGGTGVLVGVTGVLVGGLGVLVGVTGVFVGGTFVGGFDVFVGVGAGG